MRPCANMFWHCLYGPIKNPVAPMHTTLPNEYRMTKPTMLPYIARRQRRGCQNPSGEKKRGGGRTSESATMLTMLSCPPKRAVNTALAGERLARLRTTHPNAKSPTKPCLPKLAGWGSQSTWASSKSARTSWSRTRATGTWSCWSRRPDCARARRVNPTFALESVRIAPQLHGLRGLLRVCRGTKGAEQTLGHLHRGSLLA